MKRKAKLIAVLISPLIAMSFSSCNMSDSVDDLGHGYEFAHEGQEDNVIYNSEKDRLIPCNVTAYNHDDDFIIAKQTPTRSCFMGEKKINYPTDNSEFYWIILLENDSLLGPLTLVEYELEKKRMKVSDKLRLEPVEIYPLHD